MTAGTMQKIAWKIDKKQTVYTRQEAFQDSSLL
jgi:hypothetical protein